MSVAPEASAAGAAPVDAALPHALHLVGVRGGGLSALARLLVERGHRVTGSDRLGGSPELAALGVSVARGHDAPLPADVGLVVRSAAVPPTAPELVAARAAGLPVLKYAELLGRLSRARLCVGVAGTHGKTTTTAAVAHLLEALGAAPSWIVGGRPLGAPSARWGGGPHLVVEACEYDRSFLELDCRVALVTSVAPDHLDCFGDAAGVQAAFAAFARRLASPARLVLGPDVPPALPWELAPGVALLRTDELVRVRAAREDAAGHLLELELDGRARGNLRLGLLGRHQVDLLRCALAVGLALGLPAEELLAAADGFAGVARRLQDLGEQPWPRADGGAGSLRLIDDFAHHPDALRAAAAALRARFPGRRVVGVFQPHQVSRTEDFLDGFVEGLRAFDAVALCDIFVARDAHPERAEACAERLARGVGPALRRVGPARDADDAVAALLRADDVCVVMGAGDVDSLAGRLAARAAGP